ncbi:hypothetical protein RJ641_002883 [Dillenia turbinata]|uniref:Protein kinase domain-containing protein n=1 Tax=Dillenia turbinata TaxID=194707 RepID=A0AAN8VBI3_9MAGN
MAPTTSSGGPTANLGISSASLENSACESDCLARSYCIASTALPDGSGRCYLKESGYFSGNRPPFGGLSAPNSLPEYASGALVLFPYKELQHSTKGFKVKLGQGGFGAVYKGTLGNRTVAVKQLQGIEQGEKQFRMEVATISGTHHLNLKSVERTPGQILDPQAIKRVRDRVEKHKENQSGQKMGQGCNTVTNAYHMASSFAEKGTELRRFIAEPSF